MNTRFAVLIVAHKNDEYLEKPRKCLDFSVKMGEFFESLCPRVLVANLPARGQSYEFFFTTIPPAGEPKGHKGQNGENYSHYAR